MFPLQKYPQKRGSSHLIFSLYKVSQIMNLNSKVLFEEHIYNQDDPINANPGYFKISLGRIN